MSGMRVVRVGVFAVFLLIIYVLVRIGPSGLAHGFRI